MKINKLYIGLIALAAAAFTGCSDDDDYTWASVDGVQVYFSSDAEETITVSKAESSIVIPLYRIDTSSALTVALTVETEATTIYNVPTSVTFDEGESSTDIVVTYDPDDVEYGTYETITITIADEDVTTVYGISSYTFSIGATEWATLGTGQYREDLLTTFYSVENLVYEVEIEYSVVNDGLYRLVYPYGEAYAYNDEGDYDTDVTYYLTIDASDPDYVWVYESEQGLDWGYGNLLISSYVAYYINYYGYDVDYLKEAVPDLFGTMADGIITMPTNSMLICEPDYSSYYYYANTNGLFAVALPGYVLGTYEVEFSNLGTYVTSDNTEYIVGQFTFSDDIASVRYALTNDADEVDAIYEGISDGSGDYEELDDDSEEVKLAVDGTGTYYLVIVGYDSSGTEQYSNVVTIKFKSTLDAAETFTAVAYGTYNYEADDYFGYGFMMEGTEDATLYQSDSDPTQYYITPWCNASEGLVFTLDSDNNITIEENETGYTYGSYGTLWASDLLNYFGSSYGLDSYYDSSTDVFWFYLVYYVEAGWFTAIGETFTPSEWLDTSAKAGTLSLPATAKEGFYPNTQMEATKKVHRQIAVKPWIDMFSATPLK